MYISAADVARLRELPQTAKETWQLAVRKLRVWCAASTGADSGPKAVPCRPHATFVLNVYPKGELLTQQLTQPPELPPTSQKLMDILVQQVWIVYSAIVP